VIESGFGSLETFNTLVSGLFDQRLTQRRSGRDGKSARKSLLAWQSSGKQLSSKSLFDGISIPVKLRRQSTTSTMLSTRSNNGPDLAV
jgi:hypothetical protein